ncbi:MAG: T9SS type A sorting domain-containing protein [Flavobacterium psychrophilum]
MNTITKQTSFMDASKQTAAFGGGYFKTLLTLFILFLSMGVWGQTYTDNASSYSGSWTNNSNNSSPAGGFGNWSISAGANSGVFIGNPSNNGMGTTNIGTTAFGMFATGNAYCNASRGITGGMQVGDILTFYWAMNFDAGSGAKGFDLKNSGTTIFNVNNAGSSTITTTNGTAFTAYGTSPMLVTVTRISSSSYSFSMTARNGGTAYSATISNSSSINELNFYIGNQNDGAGQKNIFVNAFSLVKPNQYRSATSGNWGTAGTWEISTDGGTSWSAAGVAPGSNMYSTVTIRNTHTVSQNQNYSSGSNNNIVVQSGGTLNMTGAIGTFQFNTLSVSGTVVRDNFSNVYSGNITVNNGGKYTHAVNGGSIPTITWASGSTFEVTGITNETSFTSGSPQNFHHVIWNCTGQTYIFSFGGLTTVNGNFTVQSTGVSPSATSGLYFTNSTAITSNIVGNLTISGGFFAPFGSGTANSSILNISGNVSISGGTFDIYRPSANTGTINLAGDFSMSGGTLTKGGTGAGNFNFSKSGTQTYVKSSGTISGAINFTVNSGSTLSMGTNVLDGSTGTFSLSSGGGLETGNTAGITSTGSTGSIQVSGTRTYNTGANYTFNGSSAQATGAGFTGSNNLTINNSAGVTLSGNASLVGTLTLTSGTFTVGSGNTITVSSGGTISRSSGSLTAGSGAGTFTFLGTGTITGTIGFNNVNIAGGVNFGSASTVNGVLSINSGGFVNTNAPIYASGSTLRYNTTGTYGRGTEWSTTTGAGYPINVQISNNTTLDLGANGGTGTARQCSGSLTVDSGSTITLNATPMSQALIVKGNYTNNGTTILSGTSGGDLKLEGDMNDNGVFTANGRAIFFEGGNNQTINSSTNPLDVDVMRIGKSGGEVFLAQNLLVDETADPIQFTTAQSVLNLNGYTATFGKAGTASAIMMNASSKIKGSSLSSLTILGSGNFGTLYFDQTTPGTTNALNNLTISRSSGTFSIGNALTVAGTLDAASSSITGAGAITLPAAATLITSNASGVNGAIATSVTNSLSTAANYAFTGSTAQTTGTNLPATVNNFTISNTAGVTLPQSLTLNGTMSISGTGTSFTINPNAILTIAGTANFGGKSVTLKSDSSGTAAIGQVTGTLSNATNVTVERYIPAKRAWRALTAPLKGSNTTLYNSWQNAGVAASNFDTGVTLWGPNGTGMVTGPAYNIRQYTSTGWVDINNTQTTNLFTSSGNNAYMIFVTGGYGSNNITNGQNAATTLKATGQLITAVPNPIQYSVPSNTRHSLIGNPFASPISPSAILGGASGLFNNIWVWDPALGDFGAYVNFDGTLFKYSVGITGVSSYSSGTAIQSGQAFFVLADNTSGGSLSLTESMKSGTVSNTFRNSNSNMASIFRVGFLKQTATDWMPLDGCIAGFYEGANAAADDADGKKMINTGENIGFVRNAVNLSSEHYPLVTAQDILNLKIWNTQQAHYKLKLNTEEFTMVGVEAWLQDLYTGTSQPLNLDGSVQEYEFDVDPTVSASSGTRFRIVFTNTALAVDTPTQGQLNIYPNPATGGKVTVSLPTGNFEGCSYELINVLGQVVQQDQITNSNSSQVLIPLTGLPNSWYALRIRKDNKVVYQGKLIINN